MGFFDSLLAPIKDIINGIEKPVHEVIHIFGEVIKFTEDIIKGLVSMLQEIESLFNPQNLENFVTAPFKDAIKMFVDAILDLYKATTSAADFGADAAKDLLIEPIALAYKSLKDGLDNMMGKMDELMIDLKRKEIGFVGGFHQELRTIGSLSSVLKDDVDSLKSKLKTSIAVHFREIFTLPSEFDAVAKRNALVKDKTVTHKNNVVVEDFKKITDSVKKRLENEHAVFDLMITLVILSLVITVGVIYMATKSIRIVIFLLALVIPAALMTYFF